jgi:hypothetical protein
MAFESNKGSQFLYMRNKLSYPKDANNWHEAKGVRIIAMAA